MLFRNHIFRRGLTAGLILLMAVSARAQDIGPTSPAPRQPVEVDQLIYKGVVGNFLDTVPLDPAERVDLQRGNAVIGNALSGRSLAVLLGIASPPLMIAGLIWGVFAATRIKPAKQAPAASVAGAGICGDAWLIAEAAAPDPASKSPAAEAVSPDVASKSPEAEAVVPDLASNSPPVPAPAEVASIER